MAETPQSWGVGKAAVPLFLTMANHSCKAGIQPDRNKSMALFSKRHYEWMTKRQFDLISGATNNSQRSALIGATYQLASALSTDNPQFSQQMFLEKAIPKMLELGEIP